MTKLVAVGIGLLLMAGGGIGALAATGHVFQLGKNDKLFLGGSKIACVVSSKNGLRALTCLKLKNATHLATGTYGVAISNKGVAVVKFKSATKKQVVFRRNN